jgi:hypothetical protein
LSDSTRDPAVDEDRLPWLEAVDDEDADEGVSPGKMMALIVAALVALGIVVGGVWALRSKSAPGNVADPTLIAAAEGDYKVKPDAPGGMKVEGKGDSAFATSEGAEATGKIDTNALPEAPVKGVKGVTTVDGAGKPSANTTVAVPKAGGQLVAKTPVVVAPVKTGTGGTMVQLGAYGRSGWLDRLSAARRRGRSSGWRMRQTEGRRRELHPGQLTGANAGVCPSA